MAKKISGAAVKEPISLPSGGDAKPDKPNSRPGKLKGFDIEADTLPEAIIDAAYHSGDYPYGKRMKRKRYNRELEPLQIELQKLTRWAAKQGERIVIVFEGRDGAGKGGTIARFTQHLNPRQARIVALPKPSDTEKGQWYLQRYAAEMPTSGELVFFDRSWYNRAGVERVMGFCTPEQTEHFLREAPVFEGMLARDGVRLIKLFLTIGREMQMTRLHARWHDPLKRWKLSPIDFEAIPRFDDYSRAFDEMLGRTSTEAAPWHVVRSNDKLRTRLNAIRHVLKAIPYKDRDEAAIGKLDEEIVVPVDRYLDHGGEPEDR
ncbi:Polyphosphate:ADP phosphotransferase 1 [Hyphomicrobiales bacterium]|nr:Polyphosphate:ADP phosphotransferase 1 [Hyphomicrobiales bacterium]CAH1699346.1 Polyphosphate:ADP phosphotransferase 1 [Hyphomicrobiales bacterium]CAI0343134.1 Polyphosphate:ADP phosphotransferase 1 [Hyphomicrobiales bacterium]